MIDFDPQCKVYRPRCKVYRRIIEEYKYIRSVFTESKPAMMDEDATRELPEFKEHVQRLFIPLKPGLARVRTMEFVVEYFEPMEWLDDLSPEMLQSARNEAVKCIDIVERDMMDQIEYDAFRYIKEGEQPAWNAGNENALEANISGFCDTNIGRWEDIHFPEYRQRFPGVLNDAGFEYVKSFVGTALAAISNYIADAEEEIYYDSDSTQKASDDE